ncbi:hypothetical protein D3C83_44560 [compost metagenome]
MTTVSSGFSLIVRWLMRIVGLSPNSVSCQYRNDVAFGSVTRGYCRRYRRVSGMCIVSTGI